MSTTPTPVATVTKPGIISTFLKSHETLILVLMAGILIWGVSSRVLTYLASHDLTAATASQQALQAQLQANKAASDDQKQTLQQYQTLAQQLISSNTALAASQVTRGTVTANQQTVDKTLQPAGLAARWTGLMKVAPSTVVPTGQGYTVASDTATETVVQLETIPQLTSDLSDQKTISANKDKQIAGLNSVQDSLTAQVASLSTTITDQTKACTVQLTAAKAVARKSKLHWFEFGFVTGYVSGFLTRDAL